MSEKEQNKKTNVGTGTKIGITILISIAIYLAPQPFLPVLIYDYNEPTNGIQIWNIGLKPATNLLVEIIPSDTVIVDKITPISLAGELITPHQKGNSTIFHVYHLFNKDILNFSLESNQKILRSDVELNINSDQGKGIEAGIFFNDFLINAQLLLIIVSIFFTGSLFLFFSGILSKHVQKKNEE